MRGLLPHHSHPDRQTQTQTQNSYVHTTHYAFARAPRTSPIIRRGVTGCWLTHLLEWSCPPLRVCRQSGEAAAKSAFWGRQGLGFGSQRPPSLHTWGEVSGLAGRAMMLSKSLPLPNTGSWAQKSAAEGNGGHHFSTVFFLPRTLHPGPDKTGFHDPRNLTLPLAC